MVFAEGYSPPEQYTTEAVQGAWSDIYALAASMYRCISGHVPIPSLDRSQQLMDEDHDPLKAASEVGKGRYPNPFLQAIDTAMDLRRKKRPQTVREFQRFLMENEGEAKRLGPVDDSRARKEPSGDSSKKPSSLQRLKKLGQGRGWIALVVVLVGVVGWQWFVSQGRLGAQDDAMYESAGRLGTEAALKKYLSSCDATGCVHRGEAEDGLAQLEQKQRQKRLRAEDDAAYGKAKGAETETALREYLRSCDATGCVHRPEAKERLAQLEQENRQKRLRAEDDAAYQKAKSAGTVVALERYLSACKVTGCEHKTGVEAMQARLAEARVRQKAEVQRRAEEAKCQREAKEEVSIAAAFNPSLIFSKPSTVKPETLLRMRDLLAMEALGQSNPYKIIPDERSIEPFSILPKSTKEAYEAFPQHYRYKQILERFNIQQDIFEPSLLPISLKEIPGILKLPQPEMVAIPGGRFRMGDLSGGGSSDEKPVHRVSIGPFLMGKHEVTFEQYDAFAEATGRNKPGDKGWGRGRRPVINVSWGDAVAYAKWLSAETSKRYRLPTEAEWEYAARAGTQGSFSFKGRISTNKANYNGDYTFGGSQKGKYRKKTVEVGSLPANPWGLHEVHGNVWEWTQDCWNGSYQGAPVDGSAWERGNCVRGVVRGGSWNNKPRYLRSANRNRRTATVCCGPWEGMRGRQRPHCSRHRRNYAPAMPTCCVRMDSGN
ncbi:MAG: SUMF1/EgtB/PvdO family nonheme iron enzyme [Gammaproteobacteria bacterium]|nr:SUMF1/EgtB/PvdO family nonheme iron enzyme [Gammaproteobacteria bacterium]